MSISKPNLHKQLKLSFLVMLTIIVITALTAGGASKLVYSDSKEYGNKLNVLVIDLWAPQPACRITDTVHCYNRFSIFEIHRRSKHT